MCVGGVYLNEAMRAGVLFGIGRLAGGEQSRSRSANPFAFQLHSGARWQASAGGLRECAAIGVEAGQRRAVRTGRADLTSSSIEDGVTTARIARRKNCSAGFRALLS